MIKRRADKEICARGFKPHALSTNSSHPLRLGFYYSPSLDHSHDANTSIWRRSWPLTAAWNSKYPPSTCAARGREHSIGVSAWYKHKGPGSSHAPWPPESLLQPSDLRFQKPVPPGLVLLVLCSSITLLPQLHRRYATVHLANTGVQLAIIDVYQVLV